MSDEIDFRLPDSPDVQAVVLGNGHIDEHVCLDLLHGYLSPDEVERILSHVGSCPSCEGLLQVRAADQERLDATMVLGKSPSGELILERRGTAIRSNPARFLPATGRRESGKRHSAKAATSSTRSSMTAKSSMS